MSAEGTKLLNGSMAILLQEALKAPFPGFLNLYGSAPVTLRVFSQLLHVIQSQEFCGH